MTIRDSGTNPLYYGCLFIFLGIKNIIPFFHIARESLFEPEVISPFVTYYSLGNLVVDAVLVGVGIFVLSRLDLSDR